MNEVELYVTRIEALEDELAIRTRRSAEIIRGLRATVVEQQAQIRLYVSLEEIA